MSELSYQERRGQIEAYFDRTASEAWARLTSDGPVSRIRATVRAGREKMRANLLAYLPDDLEGRRILDAGCGTGALASELAQRGAAVLGIDLSPTLIALAKERVDATLASRIDFRVGDMLDPELGEFDHVVAMDSLIHYPAPDMMDILARLTGRARGSVIFTFAPRTPLLTMMHVVGRAFPRGNRAPAIEPVAEGRLRQGITEDPRFLRWSAGRSTEVKQGFYISRSLELARS